MSTRLSDAPECLVFLPELPVRGWVCECHGVLEDVHTYYRHFRYNALPVVDYFGSHGYVFVVPLLADPWDGRREVEATLRAFAAFGKPLLTGQCVGGMTALLCLAEWPDAFRGAALLHPVATTEGIDPELGSPKAFPDIERITAPVAIWHGVNDITSPIEAALSLPFPVYAVSGGSHTGKTVDAYVEGLDDFIASLEEDT